MIPRKWVHPHTHEQDETKKAAKRATGFTGSGPCRPEGCDTGVLRTRRGRPSTILGSDPARQRNGRSPRPGDTTALTVRGFCPHNTRQPRSSGQITTNGSDSVHPQRLTSRLTRNTVRHTQTQRKLGVILAGQTRKAWRSRGRSRDGLQRQGWRAQQGTAIA